MIVKNDFFILQQRKDFYSNITFIDDDDAYDDNRLRGILFYIFSIQRSNNKKETIFHKAIIFALIIFCSFFVVVVPS